MGMQSVEFEANFVKTIDIPTEKIILADSKSGVEASAVASHISSSSPRYSFYHYPGSDVVVFVYTCPTGSSIRERMLHASSRRNAITVAEQEGHKILKKVCAPGLWRVVMICMLTNSRSRPRVLMRSPTSVCRRKSARHETRGLPEDSPDLVAPAGKSPYR
jgi:hypothetical protein